MDTNKILIAYFDDNQYMDDFIKGIYVDAEWFEDEISDMVNNLSKNTLTNEWGIPKNIQDNENLIIKYITDNKNELKDEIREYFNNQNFIYEMAYEFNIEQLNEKIPQLNEKNKNNYNMWKIQGERIGWKNLSGRKVAEIKNGSDLIQAIVPKTVNWNMGVYMENENSNSFEVTLYHHDSPMGEFYTIKPYTPKYKVGDIVDSEEYGKVKIIEIQEIAVDSYKNVVEGYVVEVIENGQIEIMEILS